MPSVESFIKIDTIKEEHINKVKDKIKGATFEIPYRDWLDKKKPEVYNVPLDYCKFRKENGRIKDEVLSYEKTQATLNPDDDDAQKIISNFLASKDGKANENLKKLIKAQGQRDPAVMTADGFLINGNRRKWALDELYKKEQKEEFRFLKVVILPGTNEPDRPTKQDIAKLENRYEVNVTGKSSFTLFNKALTYISNERDLGIPIEAMLADDPTYNTKDEKKFKNDVQDFKDKYIEPVRIMEDYLRENNSDQDYKKVKDRFASFQEAQKIFKNLSKDKFLVDYKIDPIEVGTIKTAIFNMIKIKDYSEVEERHNELIREVPKWIKNSKEDVLRVGKIDHLNSDPDNKNQKENDNAWQMNEAPEVLKILKKCKNQLTRKEDQQSPISRLEEIIKKLNHKDLQKKQIEKMPIQDIMIADGLATEIQALSKTVASEFFDLKKKGDKSKLLKKFNKKN
tara:strand:- start:1382 stop:2743 length:1362 start_codon:yes stop_codon:yes gene_type:complete